MTSSPAAGSPKLPKSLTLNTSQRVFSRGRKTLPKPPAAPVSKMREYKWVEVEAIKIFPSLNAAKK
jgi:hypothetical protein